MTGDLTLMGGSPFDAIRRVREDGSEYWLGRDLQPLMGYTRWESFLVPVERAMRTAANTNVDVASNFRGSPKITTTRPGQDYELTRFAAYLVAMNGDPNKAEVAEAQAYFATKTREAETRPSSRELSRRDLAEMVIAEADRADRAEAVVRVLAPAASAWETFCKEGATLTVGEAAKFLVQNADQDTGRTRLYATLRDLGWVFRQSREPVGAAVSAGLVEIERGKPFVVDGERRPGSSRTRLTGKGLLKLAECLGVTLDTDAVLRAVSGHGEETA